MRRRFYRYLHIAPLTRRAQPCIDLIGSIGGQRQTRYRSNRRQCLTAKSQRRHRLEILNRDNLGGGMTRQRQRQVIGIDTYAIVANANELAASRIDIDLESGSAGV